VIVVYVSNAEMQKVLETHLHKVYKTREKSGTSSGHGPDELILSTKATEMQQIRQQVASLPDTRTGIVQSLKHRIEAGSYSVSEDDLAGKMLSAALQGRTKI
jgi:flagellar biosynthesis anti-sigma factor FlgM